MDIQSFLRAIDQGRIGPVYLLAGPEHLLIDEAISSLTTRLLPDASLRELNRQIFRGGETTADPILEAARALPLLTERRLVIVKNADRLPAREGDRLLEYVTAPNPSTCLLFVAETIEARRNLWRAIPEAQVVEARSPGARALPGWLCQRAKDAGGDLTPEAASLLVELAGEDTLILRGEIEKAILYAGGRRIGVEEIRAVLGAERTRSIFELTNGVVRRDAVAAIAVVGRLLAEGEEPIGLLAMVARELRSIWQVKRWIAARKRPEEIARLVRRPSAVLEALMARAQATSQNELRRGLQRCWEVETRLKSGTSSARGQIELLLYDLCRG